MASTMELLLALGLLVATVSAIRGVWSPCGLSMLSSITPMTEAGRGNRFSVTARWFVLGGIVGGLSLGVLAAGGAALLAQADLSDHIRWGVGAVVAIATASIDLGVFGIELPIFKRQVNDAWLRRYRGWVYGAGFGWQIGFGVATYIMTAGVFLTIGLAILGASPASAVAIGAMFGLARGSAVFIGRSATTPAALAAVHAKLDALGPTARVAALVVQLVAAVTLAGAAWGLGPAALVAVASAAAVVVTTRSPRPAAHA
jgi:hypothetical protein